MSQGLHLDRGTIARYTESPDGFLKVWAAVARAGELRYRNRDGSERIEVLSREELTNPASLATADGLPVTLLHPDEPGGLLTPANARKHQRGSVGNLYLLDNDRLLLPLSLTDAEAIAAVKSGAAREVSAGYYVDAVPRADGKYEQRNRRYNHFALVPRGRAGPEVRVCIDEADWIVAEDDPLTRKLMNGQPKITLDGITTFEVEADLARQITQLKLDYEAATKRLAELEASRTDADAIASERDALRADQQRLEGEITGLKARNDELTKKVADLEASRLDEAALADEIQARLDAWREVEPILRAKDKNFVPDYKLDATGIKRLYLSKVHPEIELRADASYVEGLYAGLKPKASDAEKARDDVAISIVNRNFAVVDAATADRQDSEISAIERARQSLIRQVTSAWKEGR